MTSIPIRIYTIPIWLHEARVRLGILDMISNELLDKFKKLYKEKFDITLTDEQATKMATDLVNLMRVLLRPDPKPEVNPEEGGQDETIRTQHY